MPWNEPGSDNDRDRPSDRNSKDPWGSPRGNQQPPDLDEVVRNLQNRLGGLLGGGRGGNSSNGSSDGGGGARLPGAGLGGLGLGLLLLIGLGLWLATGFYQVQQSEKAVELRFGRYAETKDAGLRWHMPYPIETVEIVDTQRIHTVEVGYRQSDRSNRSVNKEDEALMLTKDENIIDIQFAVQYNIKDPRHLLFNVAEAPRNVDLVVRQATESAVREIVGSNTMDHVLTEGRADVVTKAKVLLQAIIDRYESGINIMAVEMQNAQPPAQVKDAFDDAVRAREDEVRLKNEAEAYSNDIIPRARGQAARVLEDAEAYKATIVAKAEGEASRFGQVLDEYEKAPQVTRDRLYLESMEDVLSNSTKLMIDQKGGNNMIYLPLDQLMRQRGQNPQSSISPPSPGLSSVGATDERGVGGRTGRSTGRSAGRTN